MSTRTPLQSTAQLPLPDISSLKSNDPTKQLTQSLAQQNTKIYNDLKMLFDAMAQNAGILYFGDSATNGTWRIVAGTNLSIQLRVSGSWVEKFAVTP